MTPTRYEIYSQAALFLSDPKRWQQGSIGTSQRACLVGALNLARTKGETTYGYLPSTIRVEVERAIVESYKPKKAGLLRREVATLPSVLRERVLHGLDMIEPWNDSYAQHKDVVNLLTELAKKHENEHLRQRIATLEAEKTRLEQRVRDLEARNNNLLTRLTARRCDEDRETLQRLDRELEEAYAALT